VMNSARKLLALDTDRIKDYVFATAALKEIRGGSARLMELNSQAMGQLVGHADPTATTIYANGGAGLFVVDGARAQSALCAVQSAYRRQTGGAASVTGATVDLPVDFDHQRSDIRDLLRLLQLRLRLAKDRPPTQLAITALPHLRPCDACGTFPAAESTMEHGEPILLCEACQQRRSATGGPWERLFEMGVAKGAQPGDFNALGELSSPSGYLGLLYADGNAMGREIEKLATLGEVRRFAECADKAIYSAARDAIRDHLAPDGGKLPYVPLLLGGDDLVMVTRAQSALETAATLAEKFGEHSEAETGTRLSLSVGVVLAHAHFPFRTMLDLAEGALKFAKKEGAKRSLADRSLINFLVFSSANHVDFGSFYESTLTYRTAHPSPEPVRLRTMRPYCPEDLRRLVLTARRLREAPRGRLHALGDCLFHNSLDQSVMEAMTVLMRWRGSSLTGEKAAQVAVIRELVDNAGSGLTKFPWRGDATRGWRTPLLDLVEIFDFVKEG